MLKTTTSIINASQIATPITFAGDVTLSTGNLVPGTAAKGVNFTANTPAAGMTSQLLNSYEEGTWTPVITPATGSLTSYTATGAYIKVGKNITLTCAFSITTAGTAAGGANFSGAPFTSKTMTVGTIAGTCLVREVNATGIAYQGFINSASTNGTIYSFTNGPIIWASSYIYAFTMTYQTT